MKQFTVTDRTILEFKQVGLCQVDVEHSTSALIDILLFNFEPFHTFHPLIHSILSTAFHPPNIPSSQYSILSTSHPLKVRELTHQNCNPYIGACVEVPDHFFLASLYCRYVIRTPSNKILVCQSIHVCQFEAVFHESWFDPNNCWCGKQDFKFIMWPLRFLFSLYTYNHSPQERQFAGHIVRQQHEDWQHVQDELLIRHLQGKNTSFWLAVRDQVTWIQVSDWLR